MRGVYAIVDAGKDKSCPGSWEPARIKSSEEHKAASMDSEGEERK